MIAAFALAALLHQSPMPSVAPDGVFRSRGYGLVIVRAGQDLRVYHEADGACWPDPDGEDLKDSFAAVVPVADGIGLTEAHDDQASIYVFDRLPALPPACEHPDTSDRAAVLAVSDLM
jgi:carboxyl-terminal processing protease